jgi:hypothetical protein
VREMSDLGSQQFDAAAASVKRRLPVESAMPGTTLGLIPLRAFESGGTLYGMLLCVLPQMGQAHWHPGIYKTTPCLGLLVTSDIAAQQMNRVTCSCVFSHVPQWVCVPGL